MSEDLSALRQLFPEERGRRSVSLALVEAEGEAPYFEVRPGSKDIHVRVVLQPELQPVWCRLMGAARKKGHTLIPAEGSECVVLFPNGDAQADGILIGVLATGLVNGAITVGLLDLVADDMALTALGSGVIRVNGGDVIIARAGDPVSVTVPSMTVSNAVPFVPGPVTTPATVATGTITSGSAGGGRFKG